MAKTKWSDKDSTLTCKLPDSDISVSFDVVAVMDSDCADTCMAYGLKQKLSDACARGADEKLTDEEARDVMQARYNDILQGNWNVVGKSKSGIKKDAKEAGLEDELNALVAKVAAFKKAKAEDANTEVKEN